MTRDVEFKLEVLEMQNHYENKINNLKNNLEDVERKNRDLTSRLYEFKRLANQLTFALDSAIEKIQESNLIISTCDTETLRKNFMADGFCECISKKAEGDKLPYPEFEWEE